MKKNIFVSVIIASLVIVPLFVLGLTVHAGSPNDMLWGGYEGTVRSQSGLGNEDPRAQAGNIIGVLLGFLGVIAVILILLGGFKWMTSAGNEDKVAEAKKVINSGIVGLVIILMAFAIAQFVINALYNATGATG